MTTISTLGTANYSQELTLATDVILYKQSEEVLSKKRHLNQRKVFYMFIFTIEKPIEKVSV